MADGKGRGANEIKTPFVFVRHGDPPPLDWMARHPGWVRFPATLVPRPVPQRVVPGTPWDAAGAGEAAEFGPMSRPVSVGAPVVRRRRVPVHRLPTGAGGMDMRDAVDAYRQASETIDRAASTYLASVAGSAGVDGHKPAGRAAAAPDGHEGAAGGEPHDQVPLHRLPPQPQWPIEESKSLDAAYRQACRDLDKAALLESAEPLTADQLRAIMPQAGAAADLYVDALNYAMIMHGINTNVQRAAFLAQIAVESGQLHKTEEDLYYTTAHRITVFWPRLFPTDAAAAPYTRNPEALSNRAYAGKNGNGNEESGDGFRYRGRGLMQVTGRANYRASGFENNPDAMAEPQNAANSAAIWWENNGMDTRTSALLDRTQFDAVTRTVNTAKRDAQERWNTYQRALDAFGVPR
jgi:putative chitinase